MDYIRQLCFLIQLIDFFETYSSDEYSEITSDNIADYFFEELKNQQYNEENMSDVLYELMKKHHVNLKTGNTSENYKKVKDIVSKETKKCRHEILSINLSDYFINDKEIDEFSILNFTNLVNKAINRIKKIDQIKIKEYDSEISISDAISLVSNFLEEIDSSKTLVNLFKQLLNNPNVYIWNDDSAKKQELLNNKLLVDQSEIYESFVSRINDTLYLNVYCEGNLSDCYSIIHEFIHYIIVSKQVSEKESDSSLFFSEFPSVFFEYLFRLYLEENELYNYDRDIDLEYRKLEMIKNTFFASSFSRLQELNIKDEKINFQKFYKEFKKSEEFKVFEKYALGEYTLFKEIIYNKKILCDYLNSMLLDYDCSDVMIYITAMLFSEDLIKKIKDGRVYLIDRFLNMINSLVYNDMDPIYFLNYLELNYGFYDLKPISENVNPKKLEKLR